MSDIASTTLWLNTCVFVIQGVPLSHPASTVVVTIRTDGCELPVRSSCIDEGSNEVDI